MVNSVWSKVYEFTSWFELGMKVTSMTEVSGFRHGIPTQATVLENFEMRSLSKPSSLEKKPRSLNSHTLFWRVKSYRNLPG